MERARVGVLAMATLAVIAGGLYAIYAISAECGFTSGCEYDSFYTLSHGDADGRGFVYTATMEGGEIVRERAAWKTTAPAATAASAAGRANDTERFTVAVTMNGVLRDSMAFNLPNATGVVFWDSQATGTRVAAGDVFDVSISRGEMDGDTVHRARVRIAE